MQERRVITFVVAVFLPIGAVDRLLVADQRQAPIAAQRFLEIVGGSVEKDIERRSLVAERRQNETAELAGTQLAQAVIFLAEAGGKFRHAGCTEQITAQAE